MAYTFYVRADMFSVGDVVRFKTVEELKESFLSYDIDEIKMLISMDDFRKSHESETFVVKSVDDCYFTAYNCSERLNPDHFTLVENVQNITSNEVEELLEVLS